MRYKKEMNERNVRTYVGTIENKTKQVLTIELQLLSSDWILIGSFIRGLRSDLI